MEMEDYIVFFCNYFEKIADLEAEKDHQSRIIEEIARQKEVEHEISKKISWFMSLDNRIGRNLWQIRSLERWVDRHIYPSCRLINSVQIANGFFRLYGKDEYGKDVNIDVRPDRKRSQKNLFKKTVIDDAYLEQVQEELMISKKSSGMTSSGARQLNDLVESMEHRIRHGHDTKANEKKIYQEIKTVNKTRELYGAPEPPRRSGGSDLIPKQGDVKGDKDWKLLKQHKINICLDDIDRVEQHLKGGYSKVTRLKENLELLRKNISSLNRVLENVNSKGNEGCKRTDTVGDRRILTYAEKLARKGVEGLTRLCKRDIKAERFVRWWCMTKGFRHDFKTWILTISMIPRHGINDYDTRKLALKRE